MVTFTDIQKANESLSAIDFKGRAYIEVNQRIKAFRMCYPEGTIETELISNIDGVCIFRAVVKNVDIILGTGTAYEKESSSYINKTSYIENCETSAVGRALGMCGFGIDTSVASYEEVANAIKNQETIPPKGPVMPPKASEPVVKYILSQATESELRKIVEAYKIEQIADLTEEQAQKCLLAINKRKMEESHAK